MDLNILAHEFESYFSFLFPAGWARAEVRKTTSDYLRGLLMTTERKNCWTISEATGRSNPQAAQRLLRCAKADFEAVKLRYWELAARHFQINGSVGILDETGFQKSGDHSVGTQRQYSGTMGKVDNCQVAVYLTAATAQGHCIVDRRLYLPKAWAEDPQRRKEAKIPDHVIFQTKGQIAIDLLQVQWQRGVTFDWIAGDEVYGNSDELRACLHDKGQKFVLATSKDTQAWTKRPTLKRRVTKRGKIKTEVWPNGPKPRTLEGIAKSFKPHKWQRLMFEGSQGQRIFDWAEKRIIISRDGKPFENARLLVRRGLDGRMDYFLCSAPCKIGLKELARVACQRWHIETSFKEAKDLVGLDQYQVRLWESWHRHTMLAQVAHLALACIQQKQDKMFVALKMKELKTTRADVRSALAKALQPPPLRFSYFLDWFIWRIIQRHKAAASHAKTQARIHGLLLAS